jgi:hypothetical protein
MTGAERRPSVIQELLYGFDLERLYVRVDLRLPALQQLADGLTCGLTFTAPADRRLVIAGTLRGSTVELQRRATDGRWVSIPNASPHVAAGALIEATISFADLGLRPGHPFAFFVAVNRNGAEIERHPAHRPVEGIVPEAAFEKLNWKA